MYARPHHCERVGMARTPRECTKVYYRNFRYVKIDPVLKRLRVASLGLEMPYVLVNHKECCNRVRILGPFTDRGQNCRGTGKCSSQSFRSVARVYALSLLVDVAR